MALTDAQVKALEIPKLEPLPPNDDLENLKRRVIGALVALLGVPTGRNALEEARK